MPTLGAPLDFAKLEGRNFVAHLLGTAPSSPVKGQLYFNTTGGDNTLYWYDGTTWVSAKGGAPGGPAGGDLSGTYPNPQIAAGVIVDADIAAANKDGAAATPSLRTLGTGAAQAAAGNDARLSDARAPTAHKTTHEPGGSDPLTVDAAVGVGSLRTLGLVTGVQAMPGTTPLNSIAAPTADISLNSKKIANLAAPILANDAANKGYVDGVAQGLDAKASVRVATTANITLSGLPTIDGVALSDADRVLVKNQTNPQENGIYDAAPIAWQRSGDMNAWTEVPSAFVFVELGTTQADTGWVTTADQGGTLGTTPIPWTQFSGAGSITAGAGLTKTGNTIDAVAANSSIVIAADSISAGTLDTIPAPAADVSLNSKKITGLADPTGQTDAANQQYVATFGMKPPVRAATTVDITRSGTQTVDGVALVVGDRVLVKNQTDQTQNRIYVVASGAWTNPLDSIPIDSLAGASVWVMEGTTQADTMWSTTLNKGGAFGVTNIPWIRVDAKTSAGYYSSATHGAGATITIPQSTHGCRASRGLMVKTAIEATGAEVLADVVVAANGDVTVTFAASQGANTIRTTVIG